MKVRNARLLECMFTPENALYA